MKKTKSLAFSPVLKNFRTERQLTQEELAEKVGVVTSYISMMESGQKFPNMEMLFMLGTALGVRTSQKLEKMETNIRQTPLLVPHRVTVDC